MALTLRGINHFARLGHGESGTREKGCLRVGAGPPLSKGHGELPGVIAAALRKIKLQT
jgi:hypothetical protein